jgi:hypothetical protein
VFVSSVEMFVFWTFIIGEVAMRDIMFEMTKEGSIFPLSIAEADRDH